MRYGDGRLRVGREKAFVKHNYVIIHGKGERSVKFKGYNVDLSTCIVKEISKSNLLINEYFSSTEYPKVPYFSGKNERTMAMRDNYRKINTQCVL